MLTPDSTPLGGRFDGHRVTVDPATLLPVWRQKNWRERLHVSADSHVRIAVTLPSQLLTVQEYDLLEDAGILLVQIPEEFDKSSLTEMAGFLASQLEIGRRATISSQVALSGSGSQDVEGELASSDGVLSDSDEQEFLEFLNDPANQLGGHF